MAGIIALLTKKNLVLSNQNGQLVEYAIRDSSKLEFYKNELGKEVAKASTATLDYRLLQRLSHDSELSWLRQFEGLKKSLKNLEAATSVNTRVIAEFKTTTKDTVVRVDSVDHPAFTFENKTEFITETGTVIPDLKQVITRLDISVPLKGVVYWERKRFLGLKIGKKEWKSEFTSDNPFVKITSVDQILVQRR
jgi:hypothetical protein